MPLAVDLFCGLGGWTEGLLAERYHVIGFDIERHEYGDERYPGQLVLQDVRTLHGSQFKDAALIVASPPCQEFSYMAMPWRRGKQIARALRGEDEFPEGYRGSRTIAELTALFDACFRIQREASEAAGKHIPMVVENVRGAEPWVGRAKWNFGSYYLWGDVPALMPRMLAARVPTKPTAHYSDGSTYANILVGDGIKGAPGASGSHWTNPAEREGLKNAGFRFDGSGKSFQSESAERHVAEGRKSRGMYWNGHAKGTKPIKPNYKAEAFNDRRRVASSSRKAASAKIAKIPFALSAWIARTYKPAEMAA